MTPTVTVLMSTYNRAQFISEALTGLLEQTVRPSQIIVINDGSTDNTSQALSQYSDKIECYFQENSKSHCTLSEVQILWENFMNFRPLHDRVVVSRLEEDTKSAGGIIIPDTAAEKPSTGKVLAVGPGAQNEEGTITPLDVKKGDKVLFGKWSGTEVKIDGEDLLIMKESDIMGVIEN